MLNFEKHLETLMKKDIKFAIIHPSKTDEKGNITMGHIKYTDELVEIIDDIRANDKSILLRSYRRVIDKELPLFEYSQESVEKLTCKQARALLTEIIAKDRVLEGLIGRSADDGNLYYLLKRIYDHYKKRKISLKLRNIFK